jgi:phage terminase large subunit-like protein
VKKTRSPHLSHAADPTTYYANAVVVGDIVAGPLVRAACRRHVTDLRTAPARGLSWRPAEARRVFQFFENFLCLAEGKFGGKSFILEPWQKFIVGSLYGWYRGDVRRFTTAYIEVGKGNGKTPLAAALGLYALIADGEEGAQVFAAATTRDQASICWHDADRMVAASPHLRQLVQRNVANLAVRETNSFFRPVSAEARTLDGLRVHFGVLDELHAHPSEHVADRIRAGTKGRVQPLIVEITNSGYDRHSICWRHHEHSEHVVTGVVTDDPWFAYVCGLDVGDDWREEATWAKANPNLGVSVTWEYLRRETAEAQAIATKESQVKRFNLCMWVESEIRWVSMETWAAGGTALNTGELQGRRCVGGLDLAATKDLTAFVLVFPDDQGSYDVLCWFWHPRDGLRTRIDRDHVPYDEWTRDGYLELTEGSAVDYEAVRTKINYLSTLYDILDIGVDPHNALHLLTALAQDGRTMTVVQQGMLSLSPAVKRLETLILEGKLRHGNNPILTWCVANVVMEQDAAGNVKPSKKKSTERIDGLSALVTAMARAMVLPAAPT